MVAGIMPAPLWLLENPYRVLRLSANASSADAHTSASTIRRMVVLNALLAADVDPPQLGAITRSDATISCIMQFILRIHEGRA
jgi:hypothetical protein